MHKTLIKAAAALPLCLVMGFVSYAQDNTPPKNAVSTRAPASVLDQFEDFEITEAVTAKPRPFSDDVQQAQSTAPLNAQPAASPQLTDTDMRLLDLNTDLSEGQTPTYQEFETIKDSFAIQNPTAKPKSKIERFKPEFHIRTNDDVIEIK